MTTNRQTLPGRTQRGVTLVEMMVAMVVGLILLAGMIQLFASNNRAYRLQEATTVVNENARFALDQMQYDIRMGDHWGGVESDSVTMDSGMGTVTNDCAGNAAAAVAAGVIGFEGAATSPLACIPAADYQANTDVLVLRYAAPNRIASGSLNNSTLYLRSAIGRRGLIFQGEDKATLPADLKPANFTETNVFNEDPSAATYELRTVVYFIRRCASQDRGTTGVCDAADDTIPTLVRYRLQNMAMVAEDVISGVEQMQFAFGVDTDGDRSADVYQNATEVSTANRWNRVVNVKMSLVLRGLERDVTFTDTTTYRLYGGTSGGTVSYTVPAADQQFRRKIYHATIQIRNMNRG